MNAFSVIVYHWSQNDKIVCATVTSIPYNFITTSDIKNSIHQSCGKAFLPILVNEAASLKSHRVPQ